jgi:hypothetical protein
MNPPDLNPFQRWLYDQNLYVRGEVGMDTYWMPAWVDTFAPGELETLVRDARAAGIKEGLKESQDALEAADRLAELSGRTHMHHRKTRTELVQYDDGEVGVTYHMEGCVDGCRGCAHANALSDYKKLRGL